MSFVQWWSERGTKSHVAKEISGRGQKRSREKPGNQGVGDFRFLFVFQLLYFIIFFNTFLPTTPTTHTHDPPHLVTLSVLSSYVNNTKRVSQIICVKCQREVLKFSNWKNSGKKCNEALRNQLAEYHLTRQKRCAKDSPAESGLSDRLKKNPLCMSRFSLQKNAEVTFTLLVCLLIYRANSNSIN